MKVLAIYPAFDVAVNEMAMVWHKVCHSSDTRCTVLANMQDVLKGMTSTQRLEQSGNLQTYRSSSLRTDHEILSIAASTPADMIFCAVPNNMDLARRMQKLTGAPIILHTEYFLDDAVFLRRREYFGVPFLRPIFSERARQRLHQEADRILCSNPAEFTDAKARSYQHLSYLPWPVAPGAIPHGLSGRRRNQAAYIGSLSRGKGAAKLFEFFSTLLTKLPDFRLQIVGPAIDATGQKVLGQMQEQYPGRVHARAHCTRLEALLLLAESLFIFSPGRRYGWGLISDAWSTGTPIIALAEHYDLKGGVNCLIVTTPAEFVDNVCTLRYDPAAWDALSSGGLAAARVHGIDMVAETLYETIVSVRPDGGQESLGRFRKTAG